MCRRLYGVKESVSHLFFECPVFAGIWYALCKWLGISSVFQKVSLLHLDQFEGLVGGGSTVSKIDSVVWFACIWKAMNEKLFRNKEVCIYNMVESVKMNALNWLNLKYKKYKLWYHTMVLKSKTLYWSGGWLIFVFCDVLVCWPICIKHDSWSLFFVWQCQGFGVGTSYSCD